MANRASYGILNMFSLASRERCMTRMKKTNRLKYGKIPETTAAVLVPLCRVDNIPSLLYTVRSPNLQHNSGEIVFPGGKSEKNETPIETALSETQDQIGLPPSKIELWGAAAAVPGRNNEILVTPVIGSIDELHESDLKLNTVEVTEVFTAPIEMLCDPKNQFYTQYRNGFILPVFTVEDYKIWGVTAFITHSFLNSTLSKDVYKNDWMKKLVKIDIGQQVQTKYDE